MNRQADQQTNGNEFNTEVIKMNWQIDPFYYYYYYVFILSAISPYTTGLKGLFNQSDCTGTAPTLK